MAKIKLTRPELKTQRDALQRFERYLPTLKLKQQQLQLMMRTVTKEIDAARADAQAARATFEPYRAVLADHGGVDVEHLATPERIDSEIENVAGVRLPIFRSVIFPLVAYSLFATPLWVDGAVRDMQTLRKREAMLDVLQQRYDLLDAELTKIVQRVNLFEKVKIPDSREAIRRIRIHLGDEMTAGVGRAKIAKSKILRSEQTVYSSGEAADQLDENAPGQEAEA